MNRTARSLALAAALTLPLAGCGGGDAEAPATPDNPLEAMTQAAQEMGRAAEQMGQGATADGQARPAVEPVDFRRLQALLPEQAGGFPRQSAEGQRSGAMGMMVSEASGEYTGAAGADGTTPALTVKITDLGGMGGAGAMFGAAWTMAAIDRESNRDYERTTRLDGHPAYEKYERDNRSGEFQALVAGRYLVAALGTAVSDDQLREALRAVDFDALVGMRDEGAPR